MEEARFDGIFVLRTNAGLSAIFGIAYPDDALSRTAGFGDETSRMFGLYAWASY